MTSQKEENWQRVIVGGKLPTYIACSKSKDLYIYSLQYDVVQLYLFIYLFIYFIFSSKCKSLIQSYYNSFGFNVCPGSHSISESNSNLLNEYTKRKNGN
jgi:hypothetical protein